MIPVLTLNASSYGGINVRKARYMALFIAKFVEHIESQKRHEHNLRIGIYGQPEVYSALHGIPIFRKKRVQLDKLDIPTDFAQKDIVFYEERNDTSFREAYQLADSDALMITADTKYLNEGADISFYIERETLKFSLNQKSIIDKNWNISDHIKKSEFCNLTIIDINPT